MADIFLSYARADRARIVKLAQTLKAAGHTLWWDRQIDGGAEFSADIERELEAARAVIVAWSTDSIASRWVRDEAGIALEADKLIAISLDGTPPPIGFKQIHAIDMREDDSERDLHRSLANKLGSEAPAALSASPTTKSKRTPKAALLAIPLIAAIGGLGYCAWEGGLRSATPVTAAQQSSDKSIAILPFRDLSPEQQSWFSDGLAQEISAALARTPDLKVAPTSASFRYRDRTATMGEIGQALSVAHVLDGSVRRGEDRIVVDIELIDTSTGERLFTQRYDRPVADTISVQEDIATRVATALDTALDPEALADLVDSGTNNVEAYETLLKMVDRNTFAGPGRNAEVLALGYRAIDLDPEWSDAYLVTAQMIEAIMSVSSYATDINADRPALSKEFNRLIRMAETTAKTDRSRTVARASRFHFNGQVRDHVTLLEIARREYPDNAAVISSLVGEYDLIGENDKAKRLATIYADHADADPIRVINLWVNVDEFDRAADAFDNVRPKDRTYDTYYQGHRALLAARRWSQARSALKQFLSMDAPTRFHQMAELRQACADNDRAAAQRILDTIDKDTNEYWQGLILLGYDDEAVALLRPLDTAEPPYSLLDLNGYPFFDPRPFPNLMRIMERERIKVDKPYFSHPACPSARDAA